MTAEEENNENEKIKKLAEFKTTLERKVEDTKAELENLQTLLQFINQTLLEKGFKRAAQTKPAKTPQTPTLPPVMEYKTTIPLKTATGDLLANLYISQDAIRVTIAKDKNLSVNTPPFQQFLVERVLGKMQEKDKEAAAKGEITRDEIFSYDLTVDDDNLREIEIQNITPDRLRELKSSIHWTLEKMNEKAT